MNGRLAMGLALMCVLVLLAGCAARVGQKEVAAPQAAAPQAGGGGTGSPAPAEEAQASAPQAESPAAAPPAPPPAAPASEAVSAPSAMKSMAAAPAPGLAVQKEAVPTELSQDAVAAVAAGAVAGAAEAAEAEVAAAAQPKAPEPAASEPRASEQTASEPKGTTRYLSADDSNSAASPVIARKLILAGRYVQPAVVRTYEFLNYCTFDYPPPQAEPIAIMPQMRETGQPGEYSLQVAVRSQDRTLGQAPPLNLTVLLDSSGSMAGTPLELARAFLAGLARRLRPGDLLSIVACNRLAAVVLDSHSVGPGTEKTLAGVLSGIQANDITDLEKGIALAYRLATRNYNYRYLNRVLVVSDGAANAGDLALETIARHAQDSDRQGIYLAAVGVGEGFNDYLLDRFTDRGRGAYLFVDGPQEIERILEEKLLVSALDLAVKNVRLKMVMPPGWDMVAFHGEQVSARAEEVIPQYLAPNDQMIYHLVLSCSLPPEKAQEGRFEFEAEYTPLGGKPARASVSAGVTEMLGRQPSERAGVQPEMHGQPAEKTGQPSERPGVQREILKGDAVVEYAELLKKVRSPLEEHRTENLKELDAAAGKIEQAQRQLADPELAAILQLLAAYRQTLARGEVFPGSRDRDSADSAAVLGLSPNAVRRVVLRGDEPQQAVRALPRLLESIRLVPLEGYRFLALSSGPVGNPSPAGGGELGDRDHPDPLPEYSGSRRLGASDQRVFDLHQVRLELKAPQDARSFSFDFNFFSAEYPQYVNQNFNDTFYAILEAPSTNGGRPTNIAFDANGNSIEVDNNYFQQPFHPIPNDGTGFDAHGSTGWLRTGWPIRGGEAFTLTFSIHDEGDAVFDSLVLLDNFRWHGHEAVGNTDPLN
jgi:Ca-activated chloride channel family protein